MRKIAANDHEAGSVSSFGLGRIGQQILNFLDVTGARAAELREWRALDRRQLEDIGMTPSDVVPGLPDLYAHDFRVAHVAELRAA